MKRLLVSLLFILPALAFSQSCPTPSAPKVIAYGPDFITLDWTASTTSWEYRIDQGGGGFAAVSPQAVSSKPVKITGLGANTLYDLQVRSVCGAQRSAWTSITTIRTACAVIGAPFTGTFNGPAWNRGNTPNAPGTINNCWRRNSVSGGNIWKVGPQTFVFGSGAANDQSGSGKYMQIRRANFSPASDTTVFESPLIALNGVTNPELQFYTHFFGNGIGNLEVMVSNNYGLSYQSLFSLSGQQQSTTTAAWDEQIVNLSAYLGDTIRLLFRETNAGASNNNSMCIDEINVRNGPTCPRPNLFQSLQVSATSARFSWQSNASHAQLEYGSPNFSPGNGTRVTVSASPSSLIGLSANTNYDVYVRDSCGPGNFSPWVGPIAIRTRCLPVNAPFFENFNGSTFALASFNNPAAIDPCWSRSDNSNFTWTALNSNPFTTIAGPNGDHPNGSGKYLVSFPSFAAGANQVRMTEVTSPLIDLGPLTNPELNFWTYLYGANIDSLAVWVNHSGGSQRVFSLVGQQQTSQSQAWDEQIVNLGAFANDTISVSFRAYRNGNFTNIGPSAIDDFRIREQPACPRPSQLNAQALSATRVQLGWTSGGSNLWEIEYGPRGFNAGSGTKVLASSNPFVLSGLSANTAYDFIVRDSCTTGSSQWSPPISLRTPCNPFSAPYFENFDGNTWNSGFGGFGPGQIDPCYSRSDTTGFLWLSRQGQSILFNTGPASDHTTGNGKYLYTVGLFNANNTQTSLETPFIDLSSLSNPELRFWYHMYGNDIDKLEVEINRGQGWSLINSIQGQQQTSSTAPWQERVVSLSAYQGDTIRLRFLSYRTNSFTTPRSAIAIDDLRIGDSLSCSNPDSLALQTATSNSISLSRQGAGSPNFLIKYRPSGSSGPFTILSASSSPVNIPNLSPSTSYEFFVRDSCAPGDVGFWVGPKVYSTLCGVATIPYVEGFDGVDWTVGLGTLQPDQISSCWTRNPGGANTLQRRWRVGTGPTPVSLTGPNQDQSGNGKYLYLLSFRLTPVIADLQSPEIAIPSSAVNPQLYFAYHMYGNDIGILEVEIETRQNSSPTSIYTLTGQQQTSSTAAWRVDSVDLSAYAGDTVRFTFKGSATGFRGDIALDNIRVEAAPFPCDSVSSLILSNISSTGVDISWQSTNTNATTSLFYFPVNLGPGAGQLITNISSPYSLTGLNTATLYQFEVFDSCGSQAASLRATDTARTSPCDTNIQAGFTFVRNAFQLSFTSTALGADSIVWDFGNGQSSNAQNPVYSYPSVGAFTIRQRVYNVCGNGDTAVQSVIICDTLRANFSFSLRGDTVDFQADPTNNAVGYRWDLDDSLNGSGSATSAIYPQGGSKTIVLTAWNLCGDTIQSSQTITICGVPLARWDFNVLPPVNAGLRVQFDGSLSQNASSYSWDFGDGNSATGVNPIHIYSTPGFFYEVTLTVTNACNQVAVSKLRLNQVSLEELTMRAGWQLFPNPAREQVTVTWEAQAVIARTLHAYNASGQRLLSMPLDPFGGSQEISLDKLAAGLYWIELELEGGRLRRSLVID